MKFYNPNGEEFEVDIESLLKMRDEWNEKQREEANKVVEEVLEENPLERMLNNEFLPFRKDDI